MELLNEIKSFFVGRLFTFFLDYFGVMMLVELMGIDALWSKIIMATIVIVVNYIFSKKIVFKETDG